MGTPYFFSDVAIRRYKITFVTCIIFLWEGTSEFRANLTYISLFFSFVCRPEKMAKLPVILGNLDITIDNVSSDVPSKCKFSIIDRHVFVCFYFSLFLTFFFFFRLYQFIIHSHEAI